ncbi:cytidine deaminase-like protein [Thamnocephalis sphaerospora]|uniref:Deoxycytidylate deaminase n=1 Tax=Thamnocephalis sphaerospora TaxID=78915 RepID=A0A4V1IWX4_9FUNG|nr:cytidine deaminase-like protein [Thamnocephalis sphaerospora]|eukprot:RKP09069.1 cytidine deaminase-like protein [Thamnocephalis sphaerospora]
MLIGIVGPACSGRHTVARLLVERDGFRLLTIRAPAGTVPGPVAPARIGSDDDDNNNAFANAKQLLAYVTPRWRERFVTCDIASLDVLEQLRHRPFFVLLAVDAPTLIRYARLTARHVQPKDQPSLEEFLRLDDQHCFGTPSITAALTQCADIHVNNMYTNVDELYAHISCLRLTDPKRLRPSWDAYFMLLADLAALRSNCMKRRVGCIIVRERRVVATGYNGTPRGIVNCNEGGCPRCNRGSACGTALDECICLHAEENALLEAGQERIQGGNCTLYCNTCPCLGCAKRIVQMGISEVVFARAYGSDSATKTLFLTAGVHLRQYQPAGVRLETQSNDTLTPF